MRTLTGIIFVTLLLGADDPADDLKKEAARLEAAGLVLPVTKPGPMPRPRWRRIRVKGGPLSKTIQDERDDR